MPVYEIKYRAWEGEVLSRSQRVLAIPKATLRAVFNRWVAVVLFGAGSIQLLGYTGYLVIVSSTELQTMLNINMDLMTTGTIFQRFLFTQFFVCFLVCLMTAPRMIAPERQHKALPILFSRPIFRSDYIAGKFLGLAALMAYLTVFQVFVLFALMFSIYPLDFRFHEDFWGTPAVEVEAARERGRGDSSALGQIQAMVDNAVSQGLAGEDSRPVERMFWRGSGGTLVLALGVATLMTILLSLYSLACSAVTKNARHGASLMIIILVATTFFTGFIQNALTDSFPDIGLISLVLGWLQACFDLAPPPSATPLKLLSVFVGWCVLAVGVMLWVLRPVEVYTD